MHKEIIKELGLTNNETEIYLALLQTGPVSVNTIAEKTGLHRQAVYDALDRLLEKGFVNYTVTNNKKYFQSVHPEKILNYLKEKEEKFNSILPSLIGLTQSCQEDTSVEVFKGKNTIRTLYRDIIKEFEKTAGEVLISGVDEKKFMAEDKIALEQHLAKLRRLNCKERILIKDGDACMVKGDQTVYRWTPTEIFSPTPIFAYSNKMAFIILGNPNYAIIIKNGNLSESYKRQFNAIWKLSKKVK